MKNINIRNCGECPHIHSIQSGGGIGNHFDHYCNYKSKNIPRRIDGDVNTYREIDPNCEMPDNDFTIEVVCPKIMRPTEAIIVCSSTMEQKVWEAADEGLSGEQTKKWKSVVVQCGHCGEIHEYALTQHPK